MVQLVDAHVPDDPTMVADDFPANQVILCMIVSGLAACASIIRTVDAG